MEITQGSPEEAASGQESPQDFARRLGLPFADNLLLSRALTHRSYINEHPDALEDNERLEFLGDAVLDFLVGAWLYNRFPEMAEGELTRMRSALVRTDQLAEFARQIIFGVIPLTQELDVLIAKYAPEWPLDQIAAIDRNILRVSLWEFAVQRETPVKVAINEAVELAKQFGSDSAPRFVNGVLGSLAEHKDEIHQKIGKPESK